MKISQLFRDLDVEIRGNGKVEIAGICMHSQCASPGDLFIPVGTSLSHEGAIRDAVDAGAVALLVDLYNPFLPNVVQIVVCEVERVISLLVNRYYGGLAHTPFLIGIVGREKAVMQEGALLRHLLHAKGHPCGSIDARISPTHRWGSHPPRSSDLLLYFKKLREIVEEGSLSAVITLPLGFFDPSLLLGIAIDVLLFSSHLDETVDPRFQVLSMHLSRLGSPQPPLIDVEDPLYAEAVRAHGGRLLAYSMEKEGDIVGGVDEKRGEMVVRCRGKSASIRLDRMRGIYPHSLLLAAGFALLRGVEPVEIEERAHTFLPSRT